MLSLYGGNQAQTGELRDMFLSVAKLKIAEKNIIIPDEGVIWPETKPIPEGYRRGFHSIVNFDDLNDLQRRMDSIREKGLSLEHTRAHTYGEPALIWGTPNWEHAYNKQVPTVEFQISPEMQDHFETPWHPNVRHNPEYYDEWWKGGGHLALNESIAPEDIIAIHEPWHEHLKYLLKQHPEHLPELLQIYRNLDTERFPDEAGLVEYLKKHGLI